MSIQLYTTRDIAKATGLEESWVRRLCLAGKIIEPRYHYANRRLWTEDQLAYIAARRKRTGGR